MSSTNVCVFVADDRFQNRRDPMSHRIIEKRRRDRMNNCLADLSRLIPNIYLKKGRGRIEKTEIIEMAIKHLKHLQAHSCQDPANCEVAQRIDTDHRNQYRLGYHECMSECYRFIVEIEGRFAHDDLCLRLFNHLQKHFEKVTGGFSYNINGTNGRSPGTVIGDGEDGCASRLKEHPMDMETSCPGPSPVNSTLAPSADSAFTARRNSIATDGCRIPQNAVASIIPKQEDLTSLHAPPRKVSCVELPSHNPEPLIPPMAHVAHSSQLVSGLSQLREMLQNPGLPVDSVRNMRNPLNGSLLGRPIFPSNPQGSTTINNNSRTRQESQAALKEAALRGTAEEVYNFKKNIKERFHADLRHFVSSPTDEELLDDEDSEEAKNTYEERRYSHSHTQGPVSDRQSPFSRHTASAPPVENPSTPGEGPPLLNGSLDEAKDLSVRSRTTTSQWDSTSSDASSPTTTDAPPLPRSSGSTSGYSSNSGDTAVATPVRKSSSSPPPLTLPSPLQIPTPLHTTAGVPIFALHPKGSFYIPLTLDPSCLTPILQLLDETCSPILHPVNISVNFSIATRAMGKPIGLHASWSKTYDIKPPAHTPQPLCPEAGARISLAPNNSRATALIVPSNHL